MIIEDLKRLLDIFEDEVPDPQSNRLVWTFCNEKAKWFEANGLHSELRSLNLKAIKHGDLVKESQYCFEEAIAETLYNLTKPEDPFDPESPYWIIKNALSLAKELDLPTDKIINTLG